MNKKVVIKPIAVAIGATMLGSLAQLPNAAAEQNPFAMKSLANGYDVAFSSRKHEEAEAIRSRQSRDCGNGGCTKRSCAIMIPTTGRSCAKR